LAAGEGGGAGRDRGPAPPSSRPRADPGDRAAPRGRLRRPDDDRDGRARPPPRAARIAPRRLRLGVDGLTLRTIARVGDYLRVADPDWYDPLDGGFAKLRGGRWNP